MQLDKWSTSSISIFCWFYIQSQSYYSHFIREQVCRINLQCARQAKYIDRTDHQIYDANQGHGDANAAKEAIPGQQEEQRDAQYTLPVDNGGTFAKFF